MNGAHLTKFTPRPVNLIYDPAASARVNTVSTQFPANPLVEIKINYLEKPGAIPAGYPATPVMVALASTTTL